MISQFNQDLEWLKKRAAAEDNCIVSVGGLLGDLVAMEENPLMTIGSIVFGPLSEAHSRAMLAHMSKPSEPHTVSDPNTPEAKAASEKYWLERDRLVPFSRMREMFEKAVKRSQGGPPQFYAEGVRDALGWVIGEYSNPPLE